MQRSAILGLALVIAGSVGASPALADEAAAPSPICTDRPGKASSTCTVDPGHFQLEADVVNATLFRLHGTTTDTWIEINPTLKYGLTDRIDIEATFSPLTQVRTHGGGVDQTVSGVSDLFLRVKAKLYSSGPTEISVIPYVKAPTARDGVGNGAWEGGAVVPLAVKLSDTWSFNYTAEADALENGANDGHHLNASHTVNLSYSFPHNVTLSGELWADYNFDPVKTVTQVSADLGVAWLVTNDFQLDGGVNLGLSRKTPGAQVYAGISRKF